MIKSFKYAISGIVYASKEKTFKILLIIALIVTLFAIFIPVTLIEFSVLVLTIIIILGLELLNSQVERTLNIISPEKNQTVKEIKDISAAAVLIACLGSIIIGLLIFLPHILEMLIFSR